MQRRRGRPSECHFRNWTYPTALRLDSPGAAKLGGSTPYNVRKGEEKENALQVGLGVYESDI